MNETVEKVPELRPDKLLVYRKEGNRNQEGCDWEGKSEIPFCMRMLERKEGEAEQ